MSTERSNEWIETKLKFFKMHEGWGFLTPVDRKLPDIFVHIHEFKRANIVQVPPDCTLWAKIGHDRKGLYATEVTFNVHPSAAQLGNGRDDHPEGKVPIGTFTQGQSEAGRTEAPALDQDNGRLSAGALPRVEENRPRPAPKRKAQTPNHEEHGDLSLPLPSAQEKA